MDREAIAVGDPEQPDEIDRIAGKNLMPSDRDAAIFHFEIAGHDGRPLAPPRSKPIEPRGWLGVLFFERRANDRGQIADILGDQKIMLHEPLDACETASRRIAEPVRDPALMVEAQCFFRPARQKMEMAADTPEKLLASAE